MAVDELRKLGGKGRAQVRSEIIDAWLELGFRGHDDVGQ
jgi:hypothetical protein